ncbi:MAG: hypothetical protein ACK4NC_00245 [Candidatus Gracilibacteria bacterium]
MAIDTTKFDELPEDDKPCTFAYHNKKLQNDLLASISSKLHALVEDLSLQQRSLEKINKEHLKNAIRSSVNTCINFLIELNPQEKIDYSLLVEKLEMNAYQIRKLLKSKKLTDNDIGSLLFYQSVYHNIQLFSQVLNTNLCTEEDIHDFLEEMDPEERHLHKILHHKHFSKSSFIISTIAKCSKINLKTYALLKASGFYDKYLIRSLVENDETSTTVLIEMANDAQLDTAQKNFVLAKIEEKQWKNRKDSV